MERARARRAWLGLPAHLFAVVFIVLLLANTARAVVREAEVQVVRDTLFEEDDEDEGVGHVFLVASSLQQLDPLLAVGSELISSKVQCTMLVRDGLESAALMTGCERILVFGHEVEEQGAHADECALERPRRYAATIHRESHAAAMALVELLSTRESDAEQAESSAVVLTHSMWPYAVALEQMFPRSTFVVLFDRPHTLEDDPYPVLNVANDPVEEKWEALWSAIAEHNLEALASYSASIGWGFEAVSTEWNRAQEALSGNIPGYVPVRAYCRSYHRAYKEQSEGAKPHGCLLPPSIASTLDLDDAFAFLARAFEDKIQVMAVSLHLLSVPRERAVVILEAALEAASRYTLRVLLHAGDGRIPLDVLEEGKKSEWWDDESFFVVHDSLVMNELIRKVHVILFDGSPANAQDIALSKVPSLLTPASVADTIVAGAWEAHGLGVVLPSMCHFNRHDLFAGILQVRSSGAYAAALTRINKTMMSERGKQNAVRVIIEVLSRQ